MLRMLRRLQFSPTLSVKHIGINTNIILTGELTVRVECSFSLYSSVRFLKHPGLLMWFCGFECGHPCTIVGISQALIMFSCQALKQRRSAVANSIKTKTWSVKIGLESFISYICNHLLFAQVTKFLKSFSFSWICVLFRKFGCTGRCMT